MLDYSNTSVEHEQGVQVPRQAGATLLMMFCCNSNAAEYERN